MGMSAGCCQNVFWGVLVENHSITVLFVSCHVNWGPSWSCSTLCWCQQWYYKPHSTSPMAMQANSVNKIIVTSAATCFSNLQVWIFPHPLHWCFQRRSWSAPHSTTLCGPAWEYLSPSGNLNNVPKISVLFSTQPKGLACTALTFQSQLPFPLQTEAH